MGAVGCRGHRGAQTQGRKSKICRAGYFCDAMTGEISPDIMFCDFRHVGKCIGADGCVWTCMGVAGCGGTGRQENKVNRGGMHKQTLLRHARITLNTHHIRHTQHMSNATTTKILNTKHFQRRKGNATKQITTKSYHTHVHKQ